MKSHEKTNERIKFYLSFFSEVSKRFEDGVVTPEEIYSIAKKYELPEPQELFGVLIEAGMLFAFDVSIPFAPPIPVMRLYPQTPHIMFWKNEPDVYMAFHLHLARVLGEESASFISYLNEDQTKPHEPKEKDAFEKFLDAGLELLKDFLPKNKANEN